MDLQQSLKSRLRKFDHKKVIRYILPLVIVAAIPATVFLAKQAQDIRQHAAVLGPLTEQQIPGTTMTANASACEGPGPFPGQPGTSNQANCSLVSATFPQNVLDDNLNTSWNAGAGAPQWIMLKFDQPRNVARITLLTAQSATGVTTHTIFLGSGTPPATDNTSVQAWIAGNQASAPTAFNQSTTDNQLLDFNPGAQGSSFPNTTFVLINTTASQGFVAWRDIDVFEVQVPNPLPSPRPTVPLTTTATPNPLPSPRPPAGSTTPLTFNVFLEGIGLAGDSQNPTSATGNMTPSQTSRTFDVTFVPTSTPTLHIQNTITLTYASQTGNYVGTIDAATLLTPVPAGTYFVYAKASNFLQKQIGGANTQITITDGQTTTLPKVTLIAGDINGDNILDMNDMARLLDCFSEDSPAAACTAQQAIAANINDDTWTAADFTTDPAAQAIHKVGDPKVDGFDYELMVRELLTHYGDTPSN